MAGMDRLVVYYDEVFYKHKPWFFHPESPERLRRAVDSLKKSGLWSVAQVLPAPVARDKGLALRVHDAGYVEAIERASRSGRVMFDSDTYVMEYTYDAALAVLASVRDAVETATRERGLIAVVLGRPPGHHAGRKGAAMGAPTLGFCVFNGSALASVLLADKGHSVLAVDFDLHHGNGTQEILYSERRVYHVDIHQDPSTIYPGTGWPWQTGEGPGRGTKVNVILPPGAGDDVYKDAVDKSIEVLKGLGLSSVDYIVFSAGFDAYTSDGLGFLRATSASYYYVGKRFLEAFNPRSVIVVFEGGYSVGLERGLPAFLAALLGGDDPVGDRETTSSAYIWSQYRENLGVLRKELGV